jgi:hypothetical protein
VRFKEPPTMEYIRTEQVLRFAGESAAGLKSKVDIPVPEPRGFIMTLGAAFQAEDTEWASTHEIVPIRNMTMHVAGSNDPSAPPLMILEVSIADFHVKLAAPLDFQSLEKLDEIRQKMAELGKLVATASPSVRRH